MNIEALTQALESGMNTDVNKCYIPSLKKEYSFRPITVAETKTLSKILINAQEDPLSVFETLCALIQSKCIEDIDIKELNEFDRIKIIYFIFHVNNMVSDMTIDCSQCGQRNEIKVDRASVLEKMDELQFNEIKFDNEQSNRMTCIIDIPKIEYMYHFYYLMKQGKIEKEDMLEQLLKIYMSEINISFENESVDDVKISLKDEIEEENLEQFLNSIDLLPANLLVNKNNDSLYNVVSELVNKMYEPQDLDSQNCIKCGHLIGGNASAINFTS
tara:strand:+ start:253 stop:1068 length:816 start_codon:yes stop_codon:yes gene_type:complete